MMNRLYAAKLQELLESSSNLPNAVCDLGRVELGPAELENLTQRICSYETSGIDAKAHYLLAASGFNAEQVLNEIGQLKFRSLDTDGEENAAQTQGTQPIPTPKFQAAPQHQHNQPSKELKTQPTNQQNNQFQSPTPSQTSQPAQPAQPTPQNELPLPINNNQPEPIQSEQPQNSKESWDPVVEQTAKEFDDFVDKQIKVNWSTRKREVLSVIGRKVTKIGAVGPTTTKPVQEASIIGAISEPVTKISVEMEEYGKLVTLLADKQYSVPDIVQKFTLVAKEHSTRPYIHDGWRALHSSDPVKFLELQFWEFINSEISANRHNAKLGGEPSALSKIKAFVRLKYFHNGQWDSKLTVVNQTPIWAHLYYLLRSGFVDEALKLVLERTDIFQSVGSSFAVFFKAWSESPDHLLTPQYSELLHSEYNQQFRSGRTFDPYHQALCKIIGRCELSKRSLPLVATTTEDWLWLQLMLCRDDTQYTRADLRAYVLDIGQGHLASDPFKYFGILGLLGMWTDAVEFLGHHSEIDAVHFAIALSAAKMAFKGDLTLLVGRYTRFFRQQIPNLAVDYLSMLPLSPKTTVAVADDGAGGTQAQRVAREAMRELVLQTRRFAELLGDVTLYNDQTIPGSIEKRSQLLGITDKKTFLNSIAHTAAETANKRGFTLDSVLLYRLAKEPENVFRLVNTRLGLLLSSVPLGQKVDNSLGDSSEFLQLANNIVNLKVYESADVSGRKTCMQLLAIGKCFDFVAQKEWQQCLTEIAKTGLLVLSPEPAIDEVRKLADQFETYDECLASNIPNLLLMAMTCIVSTNEALARQNNPVVVNQRVREQNRGMANNCMVYAGLIQYRMPREVYAKLTHLDSL